MNHQSTTVAGTPHIVRRTAKETIGTSINELADAAKRLITTHRRRNHNLSKHLI